jgi:hypothetical protein
MLVALFLWPRVRRPLRPLLLLYPLAMGLTLMATGEHYFFDVLLGWIYAGGVMAAWAWWERRRGYVTVRGRSRPSSYRLPAANSEARVPASIAGFRLLGRTGTMPGGQLDVVEDETRELGPDVDLL